MHWVFANGSNKQCRLFCFTLWLLWSFRNQLVHDRKLLTGLDLAKRVKKQIEEYEGVQAVKAPPNVNRNQWNQEDITVQAHHTLIGHRGIKKTYRDYRSSSMQHSTIQVFSQRRVWWLRARGENYWYPNRLFTTMCRHHLQQRHSHALKL